MTLPTPAKYVFFFEEGNKDLIDDLGGKGANLSEMKNIGLPVPEGFTLTTGTCKEYNQQGKLTKEVQEQIKESISKLEDITGKSFGGKNPLIVSVRSGSKVSMPGMMDTVLNLGINDITVKSLAKKTKSPKFAFNCYKRFLKMFCDIVAGIPPEKMQEYLDSPNSIIHYDRALLKKKITKNQILNNRLKEKIIDRVMAHVQQTKKNLRLIYKKEPKSPPKSSPLCDEKPPSPKSLPDYFSKKTLSQLSQEIFKHYYDYDKSWKYYSHSSWKFQNYLHSKKFYLEDKKNLENYLDNNLWCDVEKEDKPKVLSDIKECLTGLKEEEIKKAEIEAERTKTYLKEQKRLNKALRDIKKLKTQNPSYDELIERLKKLIKETKVRILINDPEEIKDKAKVGMRVIGAGKKGKDYSFSEMHGTIKEYEDCNNFGVEWDEEMGGHSLNGTAKHGHGWYVTASNIHLCIQSELDLQRVTKKEEDSLFKGILEKKGDALDIELMKSYIKKSSGIRFPQSVNKQLNQVIEAVFKSWDNPRAKAYRKLKNIPHNLGTAVNVQYMVFGNRGKGCATGVVFSRNPTNGKKVLYGEYLPNAQGEDIVSGIKTPKPISKLKEENIEIYKQLESVVRRLEQHYKDIQDVEFTIEKGKLWILQTRKGEGTKLATLKIATDMVEEGLISKEEAITRIDPTIIADLKKEKINPSKKYQAIAQGEGASPGIVSGEIVLTPEKAEKYAKQGKKCILVRKETDPKDLGGITASVGVLTKIGGKTSHAALVTRAMNKCCITDCGMELVIDNGTVIMNGTMYREGDTISLDGYNGKVFEGEVEVVKEEKNENLKKILQWSEKYINKSLEINADTPKEIREAIQNGSTGIGLCRTEYLFFINDSLSLTREYAISKYGDANRKAALEKLKEKQKESYKQIFESAEGKKLRIKLLDCNLTSFFPSGLELQCMKKDPEQIKTIKRIKKLRQTKAKGYNPKDMVGVYNMQVQAMADAYLELDNKPSIEILIPTLVPEDKRKSLKSRLQKLIPKDANLRINPDAESVYFLSDVKESNEEKKRVQNAQTIATKPKNIPLAKITLAKYATAKMGGKYE